MSIDFDDKKDPQEGPGMGQSSSVEAETLGDVTVSADTTREEFLRTENAPDGMFASALSGPVSAADLLVDSGRVQGVTHEESLALEALGGLEIPEGIRSPREVSNYVDSVIENAPGGISGVAASMARDLGRSVTTEEARLQLLEPAVRKWSESPISAGSLTESVVAEVLGE